jgi:hypothetical protein
LGYARFKHWRVYGEEGLSGRKAALWLAAESLTLEYDGEPLARYEARLAPETGELSSLTRPRLFGSSRVRPQLQLFALDALGEAGWLKTMKMEGYSPRSPRRPQDLQKALFPYAEALQRAPGDLVRRREDAGRPRWPLRGTRVPWCAETDPSG